MPRLNARAGRQRTRRVSIAAAAVILGFTATPSFAHGGFGSAGPFWAGGLHLFVSPLALVVLVALAASVAFLKTDDVAQVATAAAVTCFLACWLLPSSVGPMAPIGGIAAGVCAALGYKPKRFAAIALGAVAGVSLGLALEFDSRSMAASAGAAVATFLVLAYLQMGLSRIGAKWPVALRVLGAWVTAISLLLGALSVAIGRA